MIRTQISLTVEEMRAARAEAARLGISLLYAVVFVPMFFFVDRLAYRGYKRRIGG